MTGQIRPIGIERETASGPDNRRPELADLGRIIPLAHYRDPTANDAAGGNIVLLIPTDKSGSPQRAAAINVSANDRPPSSPSHGETGRLAFVLMGSLVIHAALFALVSRETEITASIGEEAITVEIVVGANSAAGTTDARSDVEAESRAAARQQDSTEFPQETPIERETTTTRTIVTQQEPEPRIERAPQELATTPTEEPAPPLKEITPPERKVDEPPPDPKPEDRSRPKPSTASAPAANSVGRGRMAGDANYQGLVAARLARFKQFPPEARRRREQGSALVTFNIDGTGRVTSIRLIRGTGFAVLDQEVQAMVERASPFPAPPGGGGLP
jgi:protein TonB